MRTRICPLLNSRESNTAREEQFVSWNLGARRMDDPYPFRDDFHLVLAGGRVARIANLRICRTRGLGLLRVPWR
jgi:hypothetical protein